MRLFGKRELTASSPRGRQTHRRASRRVLPSDLQLRRPAGTVAPMSRSSVLRRLKAFIQRRQVVLTSSFGLPIFWVTSNGYRARLNDHPPALRSPLKSLKLMKREAGIPRRVTTTSTPHEQLEDISPTLALIEEFFFFFNLTGWLGFGGDRRQASRRRPCSAPAARSHRARLLNDMDRPWLLILVC